MPPRAKKTARLASRSSATQLGCVPEGYWAVLADGSLVRRCPDLNSAPLVHGDNGTRSMPADTPVLDVIAPEVRYSDRSPVKDPLEAA